MNIDIIDLTVHKCRWLSLSRYTWTYATIKNTGFIRNATQNLVLIFAYHLSSNGNATSSMIVKLLPCKSGWSNSSVIIFNTLMLCRCFCLTSLTLLYYSFQHSMHYTVIKDPMHPMQDKQKWIHLILRQSQMKEMAHIPTQQFWMQFWQSYCFQRWQFFPTSDKVTLNWFGFSIGQLYKTRNTYYITWTKIW